MWNMTLRVCLNRSVFLLFSLSRELSPFLLHEHVLSLLVSKLFILSLHSLYKFHVSCFVFSRFNSLLPASLSFLLHFNCYFYGYLTRARSTCIKCPDHISYLGNRARYGPIEVDMSTELDGPSISGNRTRYRDTELEIHSCSVFIDRARSVIELDFTIELAKHRARKLEDRGDKVKLLSSVDRTRSKLSSSTGFAYPYRAR